MAEKAEVVAGKKPVPLFSPDVVARKFIEQYYKTVSENPDDLHKYYADESSFTHTESPQDASQAISGLENIRVRVAQLGLPPGPGNCSVDLSGGSVDVQPAAPDGGQIMIAVSGKLILAPDSYPFCQSFLLVRAQSSSYYVRNSIFRLLEARDKGDKAAAGSSHGHSSSSSSSSSSSGSNGSSTVIGSVVAGAAAAIVEAVAPAAAHANGSSSAHSAAKDKPAGAGAGAEGAGGDKAPGAGAGEGEHKEEAKGGKGEQVERAPPARGERADKAAGKVEKVEKGDKGDAGGERGAAEGHAEKAGKGKDREERKEKDRDVAASTGVKSYASAAAASAAAASGTAPPPAPREKKKKEAAGAEAEAGTERPPAAERRAPGSAPKKAYKDGHKDGDAAGGDRYPPRDREPREPREPREGGNDRYPPREAREPREPRADGERSHTKGPKREMCVKNLPPDAKEADIQAVFTRFGPVVKVEHHPRAGIAFVLFASVDILNAALKATDKEREDRTPVVMTVGGESRNLTCEEKHGRRNTGAGRPGGAGGNGDRDKKESKARESK